MIFRYAIPAALALFAVACSPEQADRERSAGEAGSDRQSESGQMARDLGSPTGDAGAEDAVTPSASVPGGTTSTELVGKMVVDADGRLLGNTQRIVRKPDSEQKLAVVAISGSLETERKEVVVPLQEFKQGTVPGKLELQMSREQLAEQPQVADAEYVELERWSRTPDASSEGTESSDLASRLNDSG